MGFLTPDLPPGDPKEFLAKPLRERMQILATYWVEHGFGTPGAIPFLYLAKIAFLYTLLGLVIITRTSHLGTSWHDYEAFWREPIFYQKAIVWTMLLEAIGLAGSWGPIAGKFFPPIGGILFYAWPGTIRLPPWPSIPLTRGNRRTIIDVLLYLGFLGALGYALFQPGLPNAEVSKFLPNAVGGLMDPRLPLIAGGMLIIVGLRDKTIALTARIEQFLPGLIAFGIFSFNDMFIVLKLVICTSWIGAAFSKRGEHFSTVLPPMISNTPLWPPKLLKRLMYRNAPHDLLPSNFARFLATYPAMIGEAGAPLVLLFSHNPTVTLCAALFMVLFHVFIISTFPLAVPLEWNVLFGAGAVILFLGYPAWNGFALGDISSPIVLVLAILALITFPVLGNLRPDLVSFLPSMRQYAGNWASALWVFKPGAEKKLDRLTRPTRNQVEQLQTILWPADVAEITMQRPPAWRSMHSQGRGLFSLLYRTIADIDSRTVREAEFVCNSIIGFNFGDGHLHDAAMIAAVQERCQFEPGELIVAWVESQPAHKDTQAYMLVDGATGVFERGTWKVADAVAEQPWLPNGPIPIAVEWRRAEPVPDTVTPA